VRPALIPNVTIRSNLSDIVHFGPYRPHGFVFGDHAWPQNASDKSLTNTTNKVSYQILTRRCEILQNKRKRNVGACKAHISIGERLSNSSYTYVVYAPLKGCRFHSILPLK
jgi:hypothetical protein